MPQLEYSSSFFIQVVGFNFELRALAPIGENNHCAERLSNLILGMDGFWLEACQYRSVPRWSLGHLWRHMNVFILYSKFDLPPFSVIFIRTLWAKYPEVCYLPGSTFPVSCLIVFYFNFLVIMRCKLSLQNFGQLLRSRDIDN